jgi:hypothetical protein
MDVPVVKKKDYQLLSINDGYLSLMDLETCDTLDHLKFPEGEIGDQIKQSYEKDEDTGILVSVTSACGEEMVTGWKVRFLMTFPSFNLLSSRSCLTNNSESEDTVLLGLLTCEVFVNDKVI